MNQIEVSDRITATAPYAVESGSGALIGALFGVAVIDAGGGAQGVFETAGIHPLNKVEAESWAAGAAVYWDDAEKLCTTTSAGNTLIGSAHASAANPSALGYVRLNASAVPLVALLTEKADTDHNHDADYAAADHNHDSAYLAIGAPPVLTGTNTVWDDLRFPAQGINPPGATSDPARSTTTGLLEFSGTADNVICGVAQMPHAWKEGSAISPHLHLRFPTSASASTRWKLEYDIASVNGNFTNNSGTLTDGGTITIANPENAKKHVIADFADVAMTGHTFSAMILWKISRLASTDAADNDASAVELLEFDIHYEIDSMGSVDEYQKA